MTARLRAVLFCLLLSTFSAAAHACKNLPSWAQSACNRLDQIWTEGGNDLYFSGYAWHNRAMYSRDKINSFNELAWGGGYGRSIYDEDGDWQGLYAMAFLDSHSKVEPIAGYGFLKIGRVSENFRLGAGYTVFLTARHDIMSYVPFPGVLPLVSAGYKDTMLYATYIPGSRGAGNVLFMFGRWSF
ncbi:lipid IV(A) palmitoyltransferase PagP [Achromobacter xylosoxidans]|uniref:lipid IV(A) palmitoyltransferase PagP n=1 Tax=Alcaligenes xylosoxydans xylosoxydans TaxID=85698 RepID=UPI000D70C8FC|nr:lipid IV(A) palmitoyltransferase PagP [Achromobacter xylosoxidans]PWV39957.1 phospholipid:lipid A palmitoyltransferase [Achromobacter xylosoxidans]